MSDCPKWNSFPSIIWVEWPSARKPPLGTARGESVPLPIVPPLSTGRAQSTSSIIGPIFAGPQAHSCVRDDIRRSTKAGERTSWAPCIPSSRRSAKPCGRRAAATATWPFTSSGRRLVCLFRAPPSRKEVRSRGGTPRTARTSRRLCPGASCRRELWRSLSYAKIRTPRCRNHSCTGWFAAFRRPRLTSRRAFPN